MNSFLAREADKDSSIEMEEKVSDTQSLPDQPTEASRQEAHDLLDIVDQNVDSIVELHMRSEQEISNHQRMIERVTEQIGRPRSLYLIVLLVILWVGVSLTLRLLRLPDFDPPPFNWLQGAIGLSALAVTTMVLITQNRQAKLTDQRRHLDLQVNLLVEKKVTKLIELVEELRRDMPDVQDRTDPQAEAMQEPVEPHKVITSLKKNLQESKTGGRQF